MSDIKNNNSSKLAWAAYLSVCIIWGSTYLAIRIAVTDLPPLLSAGIRFSLAGLIMLIIAFAKGKPLPTKKQIRNQSIIGIALLLGGNGMVVIGSQWMSSSLVALFFATVPLFIALGELFLPKAQRLSPTVWIGLCIGFAGVGFLVLTGRDSLQFSLKGVFTILLGAAFWSIGSILSGKLKSHGAIEFNLGIQMLAGGIALSFAGLLAGDASKLDLSSPSAIWAILYLIFIGSLLGYNSYIYLLSVWPATRATTYTYINPFVAIFLGHIILNEPITIHIFIGAVIILSGVFMVQFWD